jgi:hypothetical protein
MATFNWELVSAKSMDNYPYKNEDGSTTLMNGVVTEAALKLTATEGETTAVFPFYNVVLDAPVPDVFAPLDNIEKSTVLQWALNKIPTRVKENIENAMAQRVQQTAPVITTIFND